MHEKLTPLDIAHEAALREDKDRATQKSPEFLESIKGLRAVIDNLKKKQGDPSGEGKNIRPLLLILSGGLTGPYATAQTLALKKMGFGKTFSQVVGISTGVAVAGYFLADNPELGETIYEEDLVKPEFYNPKRIHKLIDVNFAIKTMSEGPKMLDLETIANNPTEFWAQAVNERTGQPELINAKTAKQGILQAMHASMALPFLYNKKIAVNNDRYVDGGLDPLPIERIISQFNPTDILVLPNMSFVEAQNIQSSTGERWLEKLSVFFPENKSMLIKKIADRRAAFWRSEQKAKDIQGINIGILWPPSGGLSVVGQDAGKMRAAFIDTAEETVKKFQETMS